MANPTQNEIEQTVAQAMADHLRRSEQLDKQTELAAAQQNEALNSMRAGIMAKLGARNGADAGENLDDENKKLFAEIQSALTAQPFLIKPAHGYVQSIVAQINESTAKILNEARSSFTKPTTGAASSQATPNLTMPPMSTPQAASPFGNVG